MLMSAVPSTARSWVVTAAPLGSIVGGCGVPSSTHSNLHASVVPSQLCSIDEPAHLGRVHSRPKSTLTGVAGVCACVAGVRVCVARTGTRWVGVVVPYTPFDQNDVVTALRSNRDPATVDVFRMSALPALETSPRAPPVCRPPGAPTSGIVLEVHELVHPHPGEASPSGQFAPGAAGAAFALATRIAAPRASRRQAHRTSSRLTEGGGSLRTALAREWRRSPRRDRARATAAERARGYRARSALGEMFEAESSERLRSLGRRRSRGRSGTSDGVRSRRG